MTAKKPREPRWMTARSTAQARAAIASFVNEHTDDLSDLLRRVAQGVPKTDSGGNVIRNNDDSIAYEVRPDALGALRVISDLTEFIVPKLSRSEVSATVETSLLPADMSTEALQLRVLKSLGLTNDCGDIIDVEHVAVERIKSGKQPDVG